jgi:transcriptional regulator with XRE-family HTH domain
MSDTRDMQFQLNLPQISQAFNALNLSYDELARRLDVLPDAVKTWFSGESFPAAHRLLRLSAVLDMSFDDMLINEAPVRATPVVAYRKLAGKKTTDVEIEAACAKGRLLDSLAKYVPNQLVRPAALRDPDTAYDYLQQATGDLRKSIGLSPSQPIAYSSLIGKFKELGAVIVPVMWGKKDLHGNALHIHLPDSASTWIYLNLDVNACDFNFWMAHELAHVYTPQLAGLEAGEDFADAFAQALLFPRDCAASLYQQLSGKQPGAAVNLILAAAKAYTISPYTVFKALNAYAKASQLRVFKDLNYGAVKNFEKMVPLISSILFSEGKPDAADYIAITTSAFETPFFEILKTFFADSAQGPGWLSNVMEIPFLDGKAIYECLSVDSQ